MASNKEVEEVTNKTLKAGGILAILYFDMQSENKDDLQPIMADLITNRLLKSPGVVYCFGAIDEPIKLEKEKTYSTNAQVTTLFSSLAALFAISFNFSPAGVEILKPEGEITLKIAELQSLMLDVSQIAVDYHKYILERVLTKEDYAKIQSDMKNREELGKKLLKKDNDEKKESPSS